MSQFQKGTYKDDKINKTLDLFDIDVDGMKQNERVILGNNLRSFYQKKNSTDVNNEKQDYSLPFSNIGSLKCIDEDAAFFCFGNFLLWACFIRAYDFKPLYDGKRLCLLRRRLDYLCDLHIS